MSAPLGRLADVTRALAEVACQRWRGRRASYRPAGEPIDPSRYGVEVIPDDNTAKGFVVEHHYAASYPAARVRVGLYRLGDGLVGVAVFSVPCNPKTLAKYTTAADGVELGRLVLLDDVPANGETWFLARAFRALRSEKPGVGAVLSYSDPCVRTKLDGTPVKPGHVGVIYQGLNATYVGRSRKETVALDRDGRIVNRRALSKIRKDEQGARYSYEALVAAGAPLRKRGESGAAYVKRAMADGPFRRFRHPGNHAYVWTLHDGVDVKIESKPYPKARAA